jgi:hypothetical protein
VPSVWPSRWWPLGRRSSASASIGSPARWREGSPA